MVHPEAWPARSFSGRNSMQTILSFIRQTAQLPSAGTELIESFLSSLLEGQGSDYLDSLLVAFRTLSHQFLKNAKEDQFVLCAYHTLLRLCPPESGATHFQSFAECSQKIFQEVPTSPLAKQASRYLGVHMCSFANTPTSDRLRHACLYAITHGTGGSAAAAAMAKPDRELPILVACDLATEVLLHSPARCAVLTGERDPRCEPAHHQCPGGIADHFCQALFLPCLRTILCWENPESAQACATSLLPAIFQRVCSAPGESDRLEPGLLHPVHALRTLWRVLRAMLVAGSRSRIHALGILCSHADRFFTVPFLTVREAQGADGAAAPGAAAAGEPLVDLRSCNFFWRLVQQTLLNQDMLVQKRTVFLIKAAVDSLPLLPAGVAAPAPAPETAAGCEGEWDPTDEGPLFPLRGDLVPLWRLFLLLVDALNSCTSHLLLPQWGKVDSLMGLHFSWVSVLLVRGFRHPSTNVRRTVLRYVIHAFDGPVMDRYRRQVEAAREAAAQRRTDSGAAPAGRGKPRRAGRAAEKRAGGTAANKPAEPALQIVFGPGGRAPPPVGLRLSPSFVLEHIFPVLNDSCHYKAHFYENMHRFLLTYYRQSPFLRAAPARRRFLVDAMARAAATPTARQQMQREEQAFTGGQGPMAGFTALLAEDFAPTAPAAAAAPVAEGGDGDGDRPRAAEGVVNSSFYLLCVVAEFVLAAPQGGGATEAAGLLATNSGGDAIL
ncbi:hypothetical protein PAPYR_5420 [Paratrimastix pyriformis]|uniref:Uncharacterized protein n=1 Tax=Paratrimastix pyriformis TaxID=342808 RepID=A0ABQ8UKE0_9EUKA|nr:hypothetical protein PAPYR_5420 [Paratrimastix pyriformis]